MFLDDGTVPDALPIRKLINDKEKVKTSIEGLQRNEGSASRARAFTLPEKMPLLGGKRTMSAVLSLTDDKPSLLLNAYEKVPQRTDKHVSLSPHPSRSLLTTSSLAPPRSGSESETSRGWHCPQRVAYPELTL